MTTESEREYQRQYRKDNAERLKENRRIWYSNNAKMVSEQRKEYRKKNADVIRQYNKEYTRAHPDIVKKANEKYYWLRHDKALESGRQYRKRNPDKCKRWAKEYRLNHPESVRLGTARRRETIRGLPRDLTQKDIIELYAIQGGTCPACGKKLENNYHVDHIIPASKGGGLTRNNVQLLCPYCNMSKGTKIINYLKQYLESNIGAVQ